MQTDAILLNLDGTIIDSTAIAALRDEGQWRDCTANIHTTRCFPYVERVLSRLNEKGVRVGVVTSSVTSYAERVLKHHRIRADALIAYHDVRPHKPHPAPVLACLRQLKMEPESAVGIGDTADDCEAYLAAGIRALGAGWNEDCNRAANWHAVLTTPVHLLDYVYR